MKKLITILGPTASGKTEIACHTALELDAEIISADSRQLYKFMDIGTGKDIEEYSIDGRKIPFHLIDIKEPSYKYNIAEYQIDFHNALDSIRETNTVPILCGGSGLYIETALKGSPYLGIKSDNKLKFELSSLSEEELSKLYDYLPSKIKLDLNGSNHILSVENICSKNVRIPADQPFGS